MGTDQKSDQKTIRKNLLLIFFLAIAVRIFYIFAFPPRPMDWDDSKAWNFVALKFLKGEGFLTHTEAMDPKRPPVYPIFMAGIYKLFGQENFLAIKVAQAFVSALTCLLFYAVAYLLFGPTSALWSGWLTAFYPPLIIYSEILVSETIFIALLYGFLFLWLFAKQQSAPILYGCAGFLLGLANLCRGTILFFPLILLLFLPFLKKFGNEKNSNVLILVSINFLVIAPWTWRNYQVYGGFIPTASGGAEQFWSGTLPWEEQRLFGDSELMKAIQRKATSVVEAERLFFKDAVARIRANPWSYFRITIKKFFFFWFQPIGQKLTEKRFPVIGKFLYAGHTFFILMFIFGIIITLEQWKSLLPIYLLIIYISCLHILLAPEPRYRLPLEPIFLMFATHGILKSKRKFFV